MTLRTFLSYLGAKPLDAPLPDPEFRARLEKEAYDNMFTPAFRDALEQALDICYAEKPARPTTFTRKLRLVK